MDKIRLNVYTLRQGRQVDVRFTRVYVMWLKENG